MKKTTKCEEIKGMTFSPIRLPEFDVKAHRKLVKAYLKGFNKAIEKALKDDYLTKRIKVDDVGIIPASFRDKIEYNHSISFTDNSPVKFRK